MSSSALLPTLGCVLMAAGNAARFGKNKLLQPLNGKPIIAYGMDALQASGLSPVMVVTQYQPVADLAIERGFLTVFNPDPKQGVSSSIRLGLGALLTACPNLSGCMFCVGDQPYLNAQSITILADAWKKGPQHILALAYHGKRGNPAIFPRIYFPELLSLQGDTGGSAVIRAHEEALRLIEVSQEQELLDIDSPADFLP